MAPLDLPASNMKTQACLKLMISRKLQKQNVKLGATLCSVDYLVKAFSQLQYHATWQQKKKKKNLF